MAPSWRCGKPTAVPVVFVPAMGAASSDLDRESQAQVGWTLPHQGGANVWTNYVMSRYGIGYSVTGVSASLALPRRQS
eukprot:Skav226193  [mRNA]  locus=scaffold2212:144138:147354:+ [translate_table: standard]